MRSLAGTLSLLALLTVACSSTTRSERRPEHPVAVRGSLDQGEHAVVVFAATLSSGPGSGIPLGEIEPDTVVTIGEVRDGWQYVEIRAPLHVKGWVLGERLGCRALRDVELAPLDEAEPPVKLRPGALLAVQGHDGDRLVVETQGDIAIKGRISKAACGVGAPFIPTLPRDGTPNRLTRAAFMTTDAHTGGGSSIRLEEGQRFTVFVTKGGSAYGRTDGPVVVRGQIDAAALDRDTRTPFDRLAEPLGYTHEVLLDAEMRDRPDGAEIAKLPGGTPVNISDRDREWAKVRTHGKVQIEGWLKMHDLRRVSLDYNQLDPEARRREHVPIVRDEPRGMNVLEEQEEE